MTFRYSYLMEVNDSIRACFLMIFRPLARMAMRKNLSYGDVSSWLKRAFVEEAEKNFNLPGKKLSVSRVSIITGLSRKDVTEYFQKPLSTDSSIKTKINRARRVISAWECDELFKDEKNKPLPLAYDQADNSFTQLVKKASGDMPVRAILDELIRVGAVRYNEKNELELCQVGYVPKKDELQKLQLLGEDASSLIETIDVNIQEDLLEKHRFHKRVCYVSIKEEVVREFKQLAAEKSLELLQELNAWLRDRDNAKSEDKTKKIGLVVHYFENEPETSEGNIDAPQ
jgi:hypothetical protein